MTTDDLNQLMYQAARRIVGHPALAEDAVQQAWEWLIANVDRPLTPGLCVRVTQLRAKRIRHGLTQQQGLELPLDDIVGTPYEPAYDPGHHMVRTLAVKQAIRLIEAHKRELLRLYLEGWTMVEIGARLGCTHQRAAQLLNRAVRDVRRLC